MVHYFGPYFLVIIFLIFFCAFLKTRLLILLVSWIIFSSLLGLLWSAKWLFFLVATNCFRIIIPLQFLEPQLLCQFPLLGSILTYILFIKHTWFGRKKLLWHQESYCWCVIFCHLIGIFSDAVVWLVSPIRIYFFHLYHLPQLFWYPSLFFYVILYPPTWLTIILD